MYSCIVNYEQEPPVKALTTTSRAHFAECLERHYNTYFDGRHAICYLHVNHLKYYNRIHGIDAGDEVLHVVIAHLAKVATKHLVARYAGDGLTFLATADVVNTIPAVVNDLLPTFGDAHGLEVKMGAVLCFSPLSVDDCMRRALFACTTIGDQNDTFLCWFDGKVSQAFAKRTYVIDHLDDAIARGEIRAWAQPIVRVLTGRICEMEILARWQSEQYGFLFPDEFIPVLEQHQLIHKLDLEVIRLACEGWAFMRNLGIHVPFGINLSRLDFELCDIFNEIRTLMARYNVPVDQLHVEVTESSSIQDGDVLNEGVRRFREAGFQVYMDDFGSGYSSLGQMASLRFDVVKIDKTLLDHVVDDERARAVLADTISLVKRLGMQTLCEGVETTGQLAFLRAVGCEKAQGYFFSRPIGPDKIMAKLRERALAHETAEEIAYLDAVGQVNLIDCTSAGLHGVEAAAFRGRSPAAVLELGDATLRQLTCNFAFQRLVVRLGHASFNEMMESDSRTVARVRARAVDAARRSFESGCMKTFDFIVGGIFCSATMTFVAQTNGRQAFLTTVTSVENSPQVTEHTLLTGVLETSNLCFFWKDSERRFLGANQRFYDYYGFEGLADILGKTDEEMGWHKSGETFHDDEIDVLHGATITAAHGVCMRKGEYRDIIATKRPLYSHGAIVGLVGYFEDIGPHN